MGQPRQYVRKFPDVLATGIRPRVIRRVDREEDRISGVVPQDRDTDGPDSLYPPGSSAADRRSSHSALKLDDTIVDAPDSRPLTLPPREVQLAPTPTGDEVVYRGWDTHATVVMKAVDPALIAACRDLPLTVPSMRAVTIPPPPFRKVTK
jgi:hypothetical protein